MKEVDLPSGAKLVVTMADFETGKSLFQAVAEELSQARISSSDEILVVVKNLMCIGVYSKKIDSCLKECFKSVSYNGIRIVKGNSVFEDEKAREDYLQVCYEVALVNLRPFTKNLSALFSTLMGEIQSAQA